jgi:hypothetical protein
MVPDYDSRQDRIGGACNIDCTMAEERREK